MQPEALVALFDRQAPGYDRQWAGMSAIRDCMFLLLEPLLAGLPDDARVLCVGVGTGQELVHLARIRPGWHFVAVDPSGAMIEACRARAQDEGFAGRCRFHHGFLDALPGEAPFDAATCFLVSQFLVDRPARVALFADIAARLQPGGLLASSDLAAETTSPGYAVLLPAWLRMMAMADVTPDAIRRSREAYQRDVGVLPPAEVTAILHDGGFEQCVQFFQAGLIHAWVSRSRA
ncbi:class I SAM-dependent methyltransferase [Luteimonas sp. SJ-16]|uniref:Class I SAM-dependent methyltransferase n=2 Tax=Luteimonas deserti TaxID=2752306 RepID=A0A7Z0QPQ7_9GAMM|nr:class I SAM-dependent methyltransferase [Luteimonas deserti]